jgi:hypothetical protein
VIARRCALVAISVLVVGCLPGPRPTADGLLPPLSDPRSPAAEVTPQVAGSSAPDATDAAPLVVTADGLTMTVRVTTPIVAVGGHVGIEVKVENARETPVEHSVQCDAQVTASADLPIPLAPAGRAWDGIAGKFKGYVLIQGMAPGAVPADTPITVHAPAFPCDAFDGEAFLEPGGVIEETLSLPTDLVEGVPAAPGRYELEVLFLYDRQPLAGGMVKYEELRLTSDFTAVGQIPAVVSGAQAIDAMLAEPRFGAWLAQLPSTTWTNANLFLEHGDGQSNVVPKGTTWSVELFRENGVPRNWAIGHVDPFTGAVRNLTFCDNPCDR